MSGGPLARIADLRESLHGNKPDPGRISMFRDLVEGGVSPEQATIDANLTEADESFLRTNGEFDVDPSQGNDGNRNDPRNTNAGNDAYRGSESNGPQGNNQNTQGNQHSPGNGSYQGTLNGPSPSAYTASASPAPATTVGNANPFPNGTLASRLFANDPVAHHLLGGRNGPDAGRPDKHVGGPTLPTPATPSQNTNQASATNPVPRPDTVIQSHNNHDNTVPSQWNRGNNEDRARNRPPENQNPGNRYGDDNRSQRPEHGNRNERNQNVEKNQGNNRNERNENTTSRPDMDRNNRSERNEQAARRPDSDRNLRLERNDQSTPRTDTDRNNRPERNDQTASRADTDRGNRTSQVPAEARPDNTRNSQPTQNLPAATNNSNEARPLSTNSQPQYAANASQQPGSHESGIAMANEALTLQNTAGQIAGSTTASAAVQMPNALPDTAQAQPDLAGNGQQPDGYTGQQSTTQAPLARSDVQQQAAQLAAAAAGAAMLANPQGTPVNQAPVLTAPAMQPAGNTAANGRDAPAVQPAGHTNAGTATQRDTQGGAHPRHKPVNWLLSALIPGHQLSHGKSGPHQDGGSTLTERAFWATIIAAYLAFGSSAIAMLDASQRQLVDSVGTPTFTAYALGVAIVLSVCALVLSRRLSARQ